jgi:hypothetical protein
MGTVTITISDETEHQFRQMVKHNLGEGKGKLGKAVDEALANWAQDKQTNEYVHEAIALMKKGLFKVGKNYTFKREEAYEDA